MKVRDVMARNVVSIRRSTPVPEIAKLLVTRAISAVPVADELNRPIGIVSEGDLMHRSELDTPRHRPWWLYAFGDRATLAEDYAKANGRKAEDIMTRQVVTIEEDASLSEAAARLEKNRIKRMPVVRDGRIVGIVSRANLVQALAAIPAEALAAGDADRELKERLLLELNKQPWTFAHTLNVVAHDGTIELWGFVTSEEERTALRVAVERTRGVRSFEDHLIVEPLVRWD